MISAIFGAITNAVTSFVSAIGSVLTSVVSMFYTSDGLTDVGTLVLIASGVGLVYWGFSLIRRLLRVR